MAARSAAQQGLRLGGRRDVMPSHHERRPTTSPSFCSGCPKGAPVRPRGTASRRLADVPASPSPPLPAGGGQQASVQRDGCLVWISELEEVKHENIHLKTMVTAARQSLGCCKIALDHGLASSSRTARSSRRLESGY